MPSLLGIVVAADLFAFFPTTTSLYCNLSTRPFGKWRKYLQFRPGLGGKTRKRSSPPSLSVLDKFHTFLRRLLLVLRPSESANSINVFAFPTTIVMKVRRIFAPSGRSSSP